jgi:hypothetical protein
MITQEEKLLVFIKHQPYMTMFDVNEYVEMYEPEGHWAQPIPYITDNGKLRQMTFIEYVDMMMNSSHEEDYDDDD